MDDLTGLADMPHQLDPVVSIALIIAVGAVAALLWFLRDEQEDP